MDILSTVLNTLEFDSNFYFSVRFKGEWGITIPAYSRVARFHICSEGHSLFQIEGENGVIRLEKGDILIIPHGASHTLLNDSEVAPIMLDDAFTRANYSGSKFFEYDGGQGRDYCELLCGHFEFQQTIPHPFVEQLPTYILLRKNEPDELAWLRDGLALYTQRENEDRAGNSLIIKHLSEVIFTLAVQHWQDNLHHVDGFIAAISDPHLSKTLSAFHASPERRWAVSDLAASAAMSRTKFVQHFSDTVKMPPSQYVVLWRMTQAQKLLKSSTLPVQQIANKCGYESVTAFSKAFKRFTQQTPGEFRKMFN